jgi:hypothetical protein
MGYEMSEPVGKPVGEPADDYRNVVIGVRGENDVMHRIIVHREITDASTEGDIIDAIRFHAGAHGFSCFCEIVTKLRKQLNDLRDVEALAKRVDKILVI